MNYEAYVACRATDFGLHVTVKEMEDPYIIEYDPENERFFYNKELVEEGYWLLKTHHGISFSHVADFLYVLVVKLIAARKKPDVREQLHDVENQLELISTYEERLEDLLEKREKLVLQNEQLQWAFVYQHIRTIDVPIIQQYEHYRRDELLEESKRLKKDAEKMKIVFKMQRDFPKELQQMEKTFQTYVQKHAPFLSCRIDYSSLFFFVEEENKLTINPALYLKLYELICSKLTHPFETIEQYSQILIACKLTEMKREEEDKDKVADQFYDYFCELFNENKKEKAEDVYNHTLTLFIENKHRCLNDAFVLLPNSYPKHIWEAYKTYSIQLYINDLMREKEKIFPSKQKSNE